MDNKEQKGINKSFIPGIIAWGIIVFGLVLFVSSPRGDNREKIDFNQFLKSVKDGQVEKVTFVGDSTINGEFKPIKMEEETTKVKAPPRYFTTTGDNRSETYLKILLENNITPIYEVQPQPGFLASFLMNWFPFFLLIGVGWYIMAKRGNMGAASKFGQAKTTTYSDAKKITFKDVAGIDECKDALKEIVDFLANNKKYNEIGAEIPKGALLVGSPGTGKTLLAKALAGEAGASFITISGSDFVEMFVGVGASRVRSLFEQARKQAPCIIFIDEIDAVGKARGQAGMTGGHNEQEQTLNQLLVEMDGINSRAGVIVVAATNRVDVLDKALLRPGRFDRQIYVPLPDVKGREEILKLHSHKVPMESDVKLSKIARGTPGFSGADLKNLINEAALLTVTLDKKVVGQAELEEARDKVLMGPQRRSLVISEEEKKTTAYHEAGHAILSKALKGLDPVHKVTIIPRGMALGLTSTLPESDQLSLSKEKALNMISMMMGGRVAEQLIFKHYTTGASNDIERATQLARRMVSEWGMSDKMGPINFGEQRNGLIPHSEFSEHTKEQVDAEIRSIIDQAHDKAVEVLTKYKDQLETMAKLLLEKETIEGEDVNRIMAGI